MEITCRIYKPRDPRKAPLYGLLDSLYEVGHRPLPAYFRCLADGASGDDFVREVDRAITGVVDYQRPRPLAAARRVGNSEQKAALRRLPMRERRR